MTTTDIFMICLTAVIATAGVIGAVVFNNQLTVMQGQLDEMKSAGKHTEILAGAAKQSAEVARQTLEATQRPFVFVNSFELQPFANLIQISPKYENSGSTPTQNMHAWISWKTFPGEPPVDFNYPDIDANGNIDTAPKTQPAFIGPKATSYGGVIFIPVSEIAKIKDKTARIFIWGWIEYDDISPATPRHRTQFCNELAIVTVAQTVAAGTPVPAPGPAPIEGAPATPVPPVIPQPVQLGLRFNLYGPFNSAN
jgi:hypothetical protein